MNEPIDVAVNLLWLAPGRVGGSEQYLTRQLAALPGDSDVAPRLLSQRAFLDAHPDLGARFPTQLLPFGRDWRGAEFSPSTLGWQRTRTADVVHHGGGTAPLVGRRPILLTIHDLQYVEHPDYFSKARLAYLRWMMPHSARRAAIIATPSDFVRHTVVEALGVPAERIVVVPHGVPDVPIPDGATIDLVRQRFGLGSRPYLVYPAITHPHKGHRTLIDMLAKIDDEIALVLIGGSGAADNDVARSIREAGLDDRVVRTGRVGDRERDALIACAQLLVFPSEYEGFGAPLVEAMVLGTPIVCSDHAAVREVVGDAAVVVETSSGAAWAEAVIEALGRRAGLVAAGRLRRRRYTLEASGAALLEAYRLAARG